MIILYHGIPRKSIVLIKFFKFFQKNVSDYIKNRIIILD
nr:MAG TPA: hypothetical protein [Caudoviricetes sp.]